MAKVRQPRLLNSPLPVMPVLDIARCHTKPITYRAAKPIILEQHYLHRNCQTVINVGMFVDNILAGICCYGTTIASVSDAICGKEYRLNVIDLNRLYIYDWAGRNSESWLIGQSFRWLKKLHPNRFILISYASISDGHIGTVYQATNWLYTGRSASVLQFFIDDRLYNARTIMARYGTVSLPKLKEKFGNRISYSKAAPKNRYVYFLGSKFQKRKLKKLLRWDILPYPKRETNG